MRSGKTLVELATELERQRESRRDFVADVSVIKADAGDPTWDEPGPALIVGGEQGERFPIGPVAHQQLATYTGIPQKYYDRTLVEAPELWADNVNRWIDENEGAKRLLRVLDDRLRAFLSDGYRRLDNPELAEGVIPILLERDNLEVVSSEVTERRLYIKFVDRSLVEKLELQGKRVGEGHHFFDEVFRAGVLGNSEVGLGSLYVDDGTFTKGCTNLAFFGGSFRRRHIGAKSQLGAGEDFQRLLTDETKEAADKAIYLQVRDIVSNIFDEDRWAETVATLEGATADEIKGDPVKVVEVTAKKFDLREDERTSVLQHLIRGGDLSRYGLHSAVTRAAEDAGNYDRASELEQLGGDIIELPKNQWAELAQAA